ncbi:MAG: PHP domain-containing protein [candidate division KSB1 bacterium]|nr:PHP domain-containing protein [candidate division KSB1 bacterium]MDZ7357101.1 PHP domain-containing protein [candidate division KSB1 bacterium]MDZ7401775.1 PHP domain-containing protein [candidate division KSB1 bacterium]
MGRHIIADLHNHSTASDGEYSPEQLVAKAKELGLKAIALTDHDSIEGLEQAISAGEKLGVNVIPGVEVSLAFKRPYFVGTLHLLLYFPPHYLANGSFKTMLNDIMSQGRGLHLVNARVQAINEVFGPEGREPVLKRPLQAEHLTAYGSNITRRHFALALKEKHGIEDKELVNRIIGNDSPAYIPSGIDMRLLTPLLRKYALFRVFAHPAAGSFPGDSHYKEVLPPLEIVVKMLPEFLDPSILGLDGIEVYYPGHTKEHSVLLLEWAERYRLAITGGSDCHDSIQRPLGVAGLTEPEFNVLERLIRNRTNGDS